MSVLAQKPSFSQVFSPYLVALLTVCLAIISTLGLGPMINHTSTIFFCSVILSSWYGGLLPGLFAAVLSCLALDYYFVPPIHSFAVNSAQLPQMIIFGVAAPFFSWLNSGQRRVKQPPRRAYETPPALAGIVGKLILAVLAALAACLAAAVTTLFRLGGDLENLWITIGLASCCSVLFLIVLTSRELR
jgi:K+-sensing histidine kinase KdpD